MASEAAAKIGRALGDRVALANASPGTPSATQSLHGRIAAKKTKAGRMKNLGHRLLGLLDPFTHLLLEHSGEHQRGEEDGQDPAAPEQVHEANVSSASARPIPSRFGCSSSDVRTHRRSPASLTQEAAYVGSELADEGSFGYSRALQARERTSMRQTPLEVSSRYVHGITWPATKATVLEAMQRNGAPDDVLEALRSIDHPRYVAPSDVHQLLWRYAASPSPVNPYPHTKSTSR